MHIYIYMYIEREREIYAFLAVHVRFCARAAHPLSALARLPDERADPQDVLQRSVLEKCCVALSRAADIVFVEVSLVEDPLSVFQTLIDRILLVEFSIHVCYVLDELGGPCTM